MIMGTPAFKREYLMAIQEAVDTVALSPLARRLDSSLPPRHQATEHLSQAMEVHQDLHAPAMKHQGCPTPSPANRATELSLTRRPAADMDHHPRPTRKPNAPVGTSSPPLDLATDPLHRPP